MTGKKLRVRASDAANHRCLEIRVRHGRDRAVSRSHGRREPDSSPIGYVEIEEENNNLANLYVASYQLHSTLDSSEVLKVVLEIVINLIGAEIFCGLRLRREDATSWSRWQPRA